MLDSTYPLHKIWKKYVFSSFHPYPLHNSPLLPSQPGCQTHPCHCPPSANISDSLDDRGGQDNPDLQLWGFAMKGEGEIT